MGLVSGILGGVTGLLGGGNQEPAPTQPNVNPEAERRKAEAESTAKANEQLLLDARRKRSQKGVLATDGETGGGVLASGKPAETAKTSTVLGSGGA